MRLAVDDPVYEVDGTFLGPRGYTIRVRYRSVAVGFLVAVALLALARRAGVDLGIISGAYIALATVLITRAIVSRSSPDVNPLQLAAQFWHNVACPRPQAEVGCRLRPPPSRQLRRSRECRRCARRSSRWRNFSDPEVDYEGQVRHRRDRSRRMCDPEWRCW